MTYTFTWKPARRRVLNPEADFRVNTVSRAIAFDLQVDVDEIWWLVQIEPLEGVSLDDLIERAKKLPGLGDDPAEYISIPGEYDQKERTEMDPGLSSIFATRAYINAANSDAKSAGLVELTVGPAFRQSDLQLSPVPFLSLDEEVKTVKVPDDSVVVAVIDNGLAIAHDLFRQMKAGKPKTRVKFFWNMDGSGEGSNGEAVSVGNAWTSKKLNKKLKKNFHNGLLDDLGFYTSIGAMDWAKRRHIPIAHRLSHGTHVMGLCAGYTPDQADIDKRPIIAVSLRTLDVADPSGKLFLHWLELALNYIVERHKRFVTETTGQQPPLVINFSFGNYAGPHDGTSDVEKIILDARKKILQDSNRCQIVLPAGNSNQSRSHARFELTVDGGPQSVDWRIQPGDRSMSAVQIWLDQKGAVPENFVSLRIDGPPNVESVVIESDGTAPVQKLVDNEGTKIGSAWFVSAQTANTRGYFGVELFGSASPDDVGPFTPSGDWRLTLQPFNDPVNLKAWIVRDETLPGFPSFGRQSYFNNGDYVEFYRPGVPINIRDRKLIGGLLGYDPTIDTSLVRRSGTISGFAGSRKTVVVGGYVEASTRMALYSSTGPTNNPDRNGPDASARSDTSEVLGGILSAGSFSGSRLAMPGTSVSAPQVTRWIAKELAAKKAAGPEEVSHKADTMDPAAPLKPTEERSGGGRMFCLPDLYGKLRWPGQPM